MRLTCRITGMLSVVMLILSVGAFAMDRKQNAEFTRIMHMPLDKITALAKDSLKRKYPDEDWKGYHFPGFVFTNESVETGYKIAVKKPKLIAKIPCYCKCELTGHRNLLDCFLKGGKPGIYDNHASFCLICYSQAILAFLWSDLGATDREIIEGMEKKFKIAERARD